MRFRLPWLLSIAGCTSSAPAASLLLPVSSAPVAIVTAADAAVHAALVPQALAVSDSVHNTPPDASSPAWVVFHGPPGPMDTPMHGGPPWDFDSPRLPAIAATGVEIVLPYQLADGLAGRPNFALRTISTANERTVRVLPLLTVDEFDKAKGSDNKTDAFRILGAQVSAKTVAANASMSTGDWKAMPSCTVVDEAYSSQPPCSMRSQQVTCGDRNVTYGGHRLTVQRGTRRWSRSFPKWKHKNIVIESMPANIPVAECIARAYFDDSRHILLLQLVYMCQGGGDWCSEEPEWRAVSIGGR